MSLTGRLTTLHEPLAGRPVFRGRSRHGMEVWVAPMPGFTRSCAVVSAAFGSLDTSLPDGRVLPEGTAHFLEHEMFQTEEGDVFEVYDARGASGNAFTTFSCTSYLFTCRSGFEENLDTLLASLARLDLGDDDIAREKAIIGQEIAMYDDDPSWCGYQSLMRALYRRHPIRGDIAGTRESIAAIDLSLLQAAHAAYYHPRNLVLVAAGAVDPGAVLARADAMPVGPRRGGRHRRQAVREPRSVARREVVKTLSLSRPHVWLGIKDDPPGGGAVQVRRQVLSSLALETLFDDGGRIQSVLYDAGLVDDTFEAAWEAEPDLAHVVQSAAVDEVEPYRKRLMRLLVDAAKQGVSEREVDRARRRMLGRRLRMLNGPEPFSQWLLASALERAPLDAAMRALDRADARSVTKRLRELVSRPRAWAVLNPST